MTEQSFASIFGQQVRRCRKAYGWTQRALAHLARVRVETVQIIESGGVEFSTEEDADRIADVLGMTSAVVIYACEERH